MRSQFLGKFFLGRLCWRMIVGSKAEFERDLIRERTNAGLVAARARGRIGGQPKKLKTNGKVALARRMFADQSHSRNVRSTGDLPSYFVSVRERDQITRIIVQIPPV